MSTTHANPASAPATSGKKWKNESIGLGSVGLRRPRANHTQAPDEELTGADKLTAQFGKPDTKYGEHSGVAEESETIYDDSGAAIGTESSTERTASKGQLRESETETHGAGPGGSVTSTKTEINTLTGAEARLLTLTRVSDQELRAAVEMMARAGAFGAASKEAAMTRGGMSLSGKAEGSGGIGVQGELAAEAYVDRTGRLPQIVAAIEASIKAGVWAEGSVSATAKAHPFSFMGPMAVTLAAKVEAFAGAQAEFSAKVFATAADGIGAEVNASAMAGAKASAEGSAAIDLGPLGIDVSAEAAAFAGVSAEFSAGFRISLSGIQAKFEASSFAGAKASVGGSAGIRIRGRKLVSIKGEIEVYAGVGGKVKGSFEAGGDWSKTQTGGKAGDYSKSELKKEKYGESEARAPFEVDKNGTMKLGAALGGALGIGASVDFEAEVDFAGIADAILMGITELGRSSNETARDRIGPEFNRTDLAGDSAMGARMFTKGYDAVFETFQDYARSKASTKTTNAVKRDEVQKRLDTINPTIRPYFSYNETDKGMTQAAADAFEGQIKKVQIRAGQISSWSEMDQQEIERFKKDKSDEEKLRKVRDALRNDLAEYASKKESKGKNGVKQTKIEPILKKHLPNVKAALIAATPGMSAADLDGEVVEFIDFAAELSRIGMYFDSGKLQSTKLGTLVTPPSATKDGGLAAPAPMLISAPIQPGQTVAPTGPTLSKADQLKLDYKTAGQNEKMLADFNNLEAALRAYKAGLIGGKVYNPAEVSTIVAKHYASMISTVAKGSEKPAGLDTAISSLIAKGLGDIVTITSVLAGVPTLVLNQTNLDNARKASTTSLTKRKVIDAVAAHLQTICAPPSTSVFGSLFSRKSTPTPPLLTAAGLQTAVTAALAGATLSDDEIADCVSLGLTSVGATVTYANGTVSITNLAAVSQAVIDRRAGKRINDAELDNERRKQVMEAIQKPLESYRAAYMTEHLKATARVPATSPALDKATLQGVIDKAKNVKNVGSDVADATVLEALTTYFPSIDASPGKTKVENLVLTLVEKATPRSNDTAKSGITAAIHKIGISARDKASLQIIVDRYRTSFSSNGEESDRAIEVAIRTAFTTNPTPVGSPAPPIPNGVDPARVTVTVKDGKIKTFEFKQHLIAKQRTP